MLYKKKGKVDHGVEYTWTLLNIYLNILPTYLADKGNLPFDITHLILETQVDFIIGGETICKPYVFLYAGFIVTLKFKTQVIRI